MQIIFIVTAMLKGRCSGSISKYRKCCYIMRCHLTSILSCWNIGQIPWLCWKSVQFFSVFHVFLNKEWSGWHYLYIFVYLSKRATTFVKWAKQVAVFLLPWEFWPKKEISNIFVEHAVLFLNVVTKCCYLSSFLRYLPNRLWEPFTITRKIVITQAKLAIKSQKMQQK